MALLSSDVSRLVHHYLLLKGFENTANNLINECADLKGLKPVKAPFKLPRLLGPSLLDLLNAYYHTKDFILEELESFNFAVYNEQDSLQTLTKSLLLALKQMSLTTSRIVASECRDAFTNTDLVQSNEKLKLDASVSTDNHASFVKVTKDAFTSTSDVSEFIKSMSDVAVSTEPCLDMRCEASVNTDPINFANDDFESACSNPPSSDPIEEVDFSLVVDRLIENRAIQERIAERINRKTTEVFTPMKNLRGIGNDTLSQDISSVIKAIAEETAADPAFDTFVKDCLGLESSQGPTPVGTPLSVSSVQESEQPSRAAPGLETELPTQDVAQQEPPSTTNDDQALHVNNHDAMASSLTLCTVPSDDYAPTQTLFNQFGSYVYVTDASGHLTLVPSMVTAMQPVVIQPPLQVGQFAEDNMQQGTSAVGMISKVPQAQQNTKKSRAKKPPRKPAPLAIAPRPPAEPLPIIITIPDLSEFEDQAPLPVQVGDKADATSVSAKVDDAVVLPVATLKTKPKPYLKTIKRLTKKSKEQAMNQAKAMASASQVALSQTTTTPTSNLLEKAPTVQESSNFAPSIAPDPCPAEASSQEPPRTSAIPSALEALVRIAKEQAGIISARLPTPLQTSTGIRPESEEAITTPTAQSTAYITTPTSSSRRRNHVRQLNFGESPDLPIASSQPIVIPSSQSGAKNNSSRSIASAVPWDLALRNVLAARSEDQNVFATPKGKAKRVKKVSPVAQTPPKTDSTNEKSLSLVKRTLQEPCSHEEKEPEADKPSEQLEEEIDLIANERLEDSLPEIAISQPEMSPPPISMIAMRSTSCSQEANSNEKAAASVLIEMANANLTTVMEPQEEEPNTMISSFTQFTHLVPEESVQKHSALPVLATPQKDPAMYEGHSSMSFSSWNGEIPRTPQIRLDVTNSNSPFQVSLTKGFRFLPAAESLSPSVPLTPSIAGTNSNSSIETPYVGFNQFSSILNTPRVEALRQEFGDSPSRSLSTTMISPTQVVLGRSAPYFVPSGERANGPIMNTITTPEHVPESDKKSRRRRSSTEMEPLQLEESNDASDEATALMSLAAANVAAALQQTSTVISSPNRSDRSLEGDLINECHRLENALPDERGITRQELMLSLFGEDSENGPPVGTTEAGASSKEAKKRVARTKKTTAEKQGNQKDFPVEGSGRIAAKKATVSKISMSTAERKRGRSIDSSSEDEAGSTDQQRTPVLVAKENDESIIRELLSLARIKGVGDTSPASKKRKRSLSPRTESPKLIAGSRTPPSKRLLPSSGTKCPPSDIKSPGSEVNRDIASTSIEASFSQEELDADVPDEQSKKKDKALNKADKGKRRQLARATAMKRCSPSPIPKIIRNTVIKTPAAGTPVKLFKAATPFSRLTASRTSRHRTPVVRRRRAITSNVLAEGRELELASIAEALPLIASMVVENNNQSTCPQKPVSNGEILLTNSGNDVVAQEPEKSSDFPLLTDSTISIVNNQDTVARVNEPIVQNSISNQSTVVEDIRSPEKPEEPSSTPNTIPVSPVTRSKSDLSASMQPVNLPVDLPGPSQGRADAPSQTEKPFELVDSHRRSSSNNQTLEISMSKKKSKKRHSDPKLQSYLLLSNVSTKPPKTSQKQPDPVPFQAVQNNHVTPDNSSVASNSSIVTSQDLKTHRNSLVKKLRTSLGLTNPNNIYSQ